MASELNDIVQRAPRAPGLALIFSCDYKSQENYRNLKETEGDGRRMEESLRSLGYAVKRMHNITRGDLHAILYHAADSVDYPPSYRRVVFAFSGHGKDGALITNDGNTIDVADVVKKLSPTSTSSPLKNMVRLFFIDACRGDSEDIGRMVHRGGTSKDLIRIPRECQANFLLAFSTVSGSRSYEERDRGGMWMSLVAKMLRERDDIIQGVLTSVNEELMSKLQDTSSYPCVQQPERWDRLNERVNLFREKPTKHESLCCTDALLPRGPTDGVSRITPASGIRDHPKKTLPRSDWDGVTGKPERPPQRQCRIAANFDNSPSHLPKVGLQWSASQPSLGHKQPAVPTLCRQPTFPPTTLDTGLVAREVEVVKVHSPPSSGKYRSKLNQYRQCGRICSFTWQQDEEKHNSKGAMLGFTSCVVVEFTDGRKTTFSSEGIFISKSASREAAATNAINTIDQKLVSLPIDHSVCSSAEILVYKQKLNQLMQGTFHAQLPDYDTYLVGQQQFQCTVRHSTFGEITGSVCNSKKEAENIAACRAYSCFHK